MGIITSTLHFLAEYGLSVAKNKIEVEALTIKCAAISAAGKALNGLLAIPEVIENSIHRTEKNTELPAKAIKNVINTKK